MNETFIEAFACNGCHTVVAVKQSMQYYLALWSSTIKKLYLTQTLSNNIFRKYLFMYCRGGVWWVSIMVHNTKHQLLFNDINFKIKMRIVVIETHWRH